MLLVQGPQSATSSDIHLSMIEINVENVGTAQLPVEVTKALHPFKHFTFEKAEQDITGSLLPAGISLFEQLKNPEHISASFAFLRSSSSNEFLRRSPGMSAALISALSTFEYSDRVPFLLTCLDIVRSKELKCDGLVKFVGNQLMAYSNQLKEQQGGDSKSLVRLTTSSIAAFSQMYCHSLEQSHELRPWINFLQRHMDTLDVVHMFNFLKDRVEDKQFSGYDHMLATLVGCKECEFARQKIQSYIDRTSPESTLPNELQKPRPPENHFATAAIITVGLTATQMMGVVTGVKTFGDAMTDIALYSVLLSCLIIGVSQLSSSKGQSREKRPKDDYLKFSFQALREKYQEKASDRVTS